MEVETRVPIGPPPRPISKGPSYSPITPERGPTPDLQQPTPTRDGPENKPAAEGNAEVPVGSTDARTGVPVGTGLGMAEKLRLATGGIQTTGLGGSMLIDGAQALQGANPFPDGNPAFQPLANQSLEDVDMVMPPLVDDSAFMESGASVQDSEPNRIRAFAKLEFDDGQFYMNTYAIEIGRDRDAARQAERKKLEEHDRKESEGRSRDGSVPDLERAQKHPDPGMSAAASVVSGGIMHMGDSEERGRRKKKRSKSNGSSGKGASFRESTQQNGKTDYQALANASLLDRHAARPVDLTNMMPSPDECPLIPIHPPPASEVGLTGHKGISRKHVRIAYNHEKGLFELHVLGKNGCFLDGAHMERGEVLALASGTEIQIGGVSMRFILPNVPDGETGTDLRSDVVSQSGMSFDFEDGRGESAAGEQDSESPTTDNEDDRYRELRMAQKAEALLSDDDDDDDDMEDEEEETKVDVRRSRPKIMLKLSSKGKTKQAAEEEAPPKRKVGRPPKNGIMSKREEAELRRKEKEAAKAKAKEKKEKKSKKAADDFEETVVKTEEDEAEMVPSSPLDKRKGGKKKPEQLVEQASAVIESIEKDASQTPIEAPPQLPVPAPKPPKKERPVKPPRSPSPVFNEAELTPEQLAKPTASYVVLIHEALSNHPDGRMSLPQIYRAIERRYPYYKLRVQTVGWQSSVRHNLSQHPAFVKIERDGKGWMWGLDPNVSIEREKKRRPSPPPMQNPGWNNAGANTFNRNFSQSVYTGTNGQMPQNPYAVYPNGPPPAGRGFPPNNSTARPPFPGQQPSSNAPATYQSPYGANRAPGQNPSEGEQGQAQQPHQQQQQQQHQHQIQQLKQAQQQHQQPTNQAVPQMPAPYLNQNRGQPGAQGQGSQQQGQVNASLGQSITASAQHARTGLPAQTASQQAQKPSGQPSPAFSPPPGSNPYGVPGPMWGAIERFRSALKAAMSAIPDGEAMVNQAISKCIGLPPPANQPYKEFAKENSVMMPLKGMLTRFNWPVEGMIAFAEGKRPDKPHLPSAGPPASPASISRPASAHSPVSRVASVGNGVTSRPPPPLPPQYQAQPQRPVSSVQQQANAQQPGQPPRPTSGVPSGLKPSTAYTLPAGASQAGSTAATTTQNTSVLSNNAATTAMTNRPPASGPQQAPVVSPAQSAAKPAPATTPPNQQTPPNSSTPQTAVQVQAAPAAAPATTSAAPVTAPAAAPATSPDSQPGLISGTKPPYQALGAPLDPNLKRARSIGDVSAEAAAGSQAASPTTGEPPTKKQAQ